MKQKTHSEIKLMKKVNRIIIYLVLIVLSFTFIFPFLWLISTSLKPVEQTMQMPPVWLPKTYYIYHNNEKIDVIYKPGGANLKEIDSLIEVRETGKNIEQPRTFHIKKQDIHSRINFRFSNYADVFKKIPFLLYLKNTLIICILGVIGVLLSNSLVAYGFSKINWKGRDTIFYISLATMMIPFPVIMIPLFTVFKKLGMTGTLMPLWIPAFFGGAFNIFLLRQFYRTIPNELMEAAKIDGCNDFHIFYKIILPLSRPILTVIGLFHFMYAWNDFMGPLIYLVDQNTFTLSLGLQFFQSQAGGTDWNLLMAGSVLIILPIILLFFFAQKMFIENVTLSGTKG